MNVFDVLTCGSAVVDVFAHTDNEIRKIREHGHLTECMMYPVGAKMIIQNLSQKVGGGGTNTAVAFSRQGLHTGYIGCLGQDASAQMVFEELQKHQISFLGHTCAHHTGYSIVLDSIAHDRTILTYKGANDHLNFASLHLRNVRTKGLYCSSMIEGSFKQQVQLCNWAKKQHALVAYNPSAYQTCDGLRKLRPMLKLTDVLICNKEEAQSLLGTSAVGRRLAQQMSQLVPTAIITDGPHTIAASHRRRLFELYPKTVKVVETTGAGDAFASALFAAMIKELPFERCLMHGLANSQSVIGHTGAKEGLLSEKQIENYIKKHKLAKCVQHYDYTL